MLLVSLALLYGGLFLPAITIRRLLFSQEYSLFEGVMSFLQAGDYFLFAVTFAFSVALPTVKILSGLLVWLTGAAAGPVSHRTLQVLSITSKWSMLDVFIIALAVLVIDGQLISAADTHSGLIAFTAAVLLSTFAVKRTARLADQAVADAAV